MDGVIGAKRVLVIEDEPAIAFEVEAHLRELGYHPVGPVFCASDATELIDTQTFDAAVIDYGLIRDDMAMLRPLVARQTPIVFMTGHEHPDLPSWLPPAEVCRKPCSVQDLDDKLNHLLQKRFSMTP